MSHDITISDELFTRIQSHAVPLVDTIETAINRIIDALEDLQGKSDSSSLKTFDPALPPNLGHTTVMSATVNGVALKPADTYWNNILVAVIKEMAKKGLTGKALADCIPSNKWVGEKTDNGYKFIKEAGISIQGLDANNAWKSIYFLCSTSGLGVEVTFRWQNKEGVEMPGDVGRLTIKGVENKSFASK